MKDLKQIFKSSKAFLKEMIEDKLGMGIGDIYPVMLTISLVAILIAIVLYILDTLSGNLVNHSAAQNATDTIITQIADFVPWIGIILLVVAAAIIIGILVRNLAGGTRV